MGKRWLLSLVPLVCAGCLPQKIDYIVLLETVLAVLDVNLAICPYTYS